MNNSITKLIRYLLLVGVIIFLALVIFPLIVGRQGAFNSLKFQEKQTNLTVSRALTHAYWSELISLLVGGRDSSTDVAGLEQALDELLAESSVVKVNLFNRDGVTVHSTDAASIGEKESDNANLAAALKGEISQEFEQYTVGEKNNAKEIQILAVYLPIYHTANTTTDHHETDQHEEADHESGEIIGVFEMYSNVTPQIQGINRGQFGIALSTTVLLLLIYGSAFFFLRRATKTVSSHQNELERYAHLVRHTPTILFEVTRAGTVLYLNPSAKRRFPELGSPDLTNAEALRHPLLIAWESITNNLQAGSTFERELRVADRVYMQRVSYNEGSQNYDIYIHDVTLQKRSEAELLRAQGEQRAILDAIPDMMFVADKEGVLLECKVDQKHQDIQGLVGHNFRDMGLIPADVAGQFDEVGRNVLAKQHVQQMEYSLVGETGQTAFYEARVIPLGSERVMSLVRDVTQRKVQELALQESEARVRSLLEAIPDMVFVMSNDGTYLDFKLDKTHQLIEDLVGRNVRELSFMPSEVAQGIADTLSVASRTGQTQSFEYSIEGRIEHQRRLAHYEARFTRIDHEKVLMFVRDVTKRYEDERALHTSEAQVRSLLEAIPDMVFVMGRDGTYLDFKLDKSHQLLEELVGRNVRDLTFMTADIAEELVTKLQLATDTKQVQTLEYSLEGYFGDTRRLTHYEARFAPIDQETILMVVRDVTQRHDDEAALQTLTGEAQRHTQELLLLDKVRSVATQELELKQVISKTVNVIAETFDYTLVSIYLLEGQLPETQELALQHQVGYQAFIERLPLDKGVMGKVARTGQSVLLKNSKDDPDVIWAFPGINSEICVPLLDTGRVVGVLNVESTEKRFFDEADLQLMTALSDTLGVAIERARLYSETRLREAEYRELYGHSNQQALELARRNDELALLDNVRSALLSQLELKDFYQAVTQAVTKHLGYPCAFIYEVEGDTFKLAHQVGYATSLSTMPISQGVCGRVLRTGAAILVPDVALDPDHVSVQSNILSGIYVPFYYNGVVRGVLSVETLREQNVELTQHDLGLLSSLSDMISLGITRVQLYSDLKTNEERYRELIENASDIIYRIDLKGYFTYSNSVVKRLLGYNEAEVIGRHYLELVREDHRQRMQTFYIQQLKENLATTYLEFPALDVHGKEVWLGQNVSLVFDQGRIIGMQAVARDVTERKRMEEALLEQAEELSTANADLEQFAFIAAHDLQEPLRKIQAFGDRLNFKYKNVLDDQGRDYLERMRGSATRMRTLIDDLLSFARANKQQQRSLVSLETIVKGVLGDLQVRIEETEATISVGTLPTLEVDPSQLRQVFQNLLSNALKFRRPDVPPVITVYSHRLMTTGEWEIRVSDNGIGFEEQYKERIFAVFQRLHSREQYEGTGIGLAIVRRIIDAHDGTIEVSSRLGEGTTFTVTLPGVAKIATENSPETVLA
jgi:PAS domain S-box-containing protein